MHSAAAGKCRFQQVGCVEGAAGGRTAPIRVWISSMNRMALGLSTSCFQHRFQALLEVAAILGAARSAPMSSA